MTPRRVAANLAGGALVMAVTIAASRIIGFGRWLVFSNAVGSTEIGTAYTNANTVPNVLYEVAAGGALAGAVVPLLAGPLVAGRRDEANQTVSALMTWTICVLVPLSVILAALSGPISTLLRVPGNQQGLAARLLVIFAPQVVLYGIGVVVTGVLQAHKKFFWPVFAPILSSIVVISSYLLFHHELQTVGAVADISDSRSIDLAVKYLGWGTTLGVAAMSLPLLIPAWRAGMRLRWTWRFPAGVAARAGRLAVAGVGALLAQQVAVVVTMLLANEYGGVGAHTTFLYAQTVYFLPYAVLAVPLATSAFPRLAEAAQSGDRRAYAAGAATSTRSVLIVAAAGMVALIAAAPSVQRVFSSLDAGSPDGLTQALELMAPGLLGFALIAHISRVLYAAERGRAAVLTVSAGWLTVVVASVVAVRLRGGGDSTIVTTLTGLGIGSSVGMSVAGVLLLIALHRTVGARALHGLGRTVGVICVGSVGAWVGRLIADGVGQGAEGMIGAILAGGLGALGAVGVLAACIFALDRGAVRALLARQ